MKVIRFSIDAEGLSHQSCQEDFLETEVPDNWDDMTEDEQFKFAKTVFKENFYWGYQVVELDQ
ncbi:hypothetical protein ACKLNO_03875 [Neisseriaceae bacterium B1]